METIHLCYCRSASAVSTQFSVLAVSAYDETNLGLKSILYFCQFAGARGQQLRTAYSEGVFASHENTQHTTRTTYHCLLFHVQTSASAASLFVADIHTHSFLTTGAKLATHRIYSSTSAHCPQQSGHIFDLLSLAHLTSSHTSI